MTQSIDISDEELVRSAHSGERDALAPLYERYSAGIYDFSLRTLRDPDAAADVVQATFVSAWQSMRKKLITGNVKAWLYTIARNNAIDYLRSRRRFAGAGHSDEEMARYAALAPNTISDPDAAALNKEISDLVWESAAALSSKEYSLLDLHVRRGLDTEELAARLGVSKGNVYTMLSRARSSLGESVAGLLLMRHGRRDCPKLDALIGPGN